MAARVRRTGRLVVVLLAALLLVGVAAVAIWAIVRGQSPLPPLPGEERCVATAGGHSAVLTPEQAQYASIIVGVSVKRGLPPRAATIALTTAYQETGIRNLDYGDRDSVGLFQQRPSQGWGTEKQLMDPYYASNKFYDALEKIKNWSTRDITTVAQAVQRSAYPEAYRDHEADARSVASALTGQTPAGFSCLDRADAPGAPGQLAAALTRTYGKLDISRAGNVVTVTAGSAQHAWAYGSFAVANAATYGTVEVTVADRQWQTDIYNLPDWVKPQTSVAKTTVRITLR
jgi:hypothetical protein